MSVDVDIIMCTLVSVQMWLSCVQRSVDLRCLTVQKNNDDVGDVVTVTLRKSDGGLGLGVVDGKVSGSCQRS